MANCTKINSCEKINIILDKDMFEFQYANSIREVCEKCDRKHIQEKTCPHCGKRIE